MVTDDRRLRIVLVMEHALVRESLAAALSHQGAFEVVGSEADGNAVANAYASARPDVTVVDMQLPPETVTLMLETLRALHPKAVVILLSCAHKPHEIRRARVLGANGCVSRHRGLGFFSSFIKQVVEERLDWISSPCSKETGDDSLSAREVEVLEAARRGLNNADIGRALHISEHTVKSHIKSILQKLHAADRAEAVARGFERGILY